MWLLQLLVLLLALLWLVGWWGIDHRTPHLEKESVMKGLMMSDAVAQQQMMISSSSNSNRKHQTHTHAIILQHWSQGYSPPFSKLNTHDDPVHPTIWRNGAAWWFHLTSSLKDQIVLARKARCWVHQMVPVLSTSHTLPSSSACWTKSTQWGGYKYI
jgi:hypothetical protein